VFEDLDKDVGMEKMNELLLKEIGVVIIGRNEGERLVTCIKSAQNDVSHIVYVDSGSMDASLAEAKNLSVDTVELDMSIPFTAARARNEGAEYLIASYPFLKYIQFVDGDCEVQPSWLSKAYDFLTTKTDYAIACGRRRERYPGHSIYNQLCDLEWNSAIGEANSCGGDALIRIEAFQKVNGFDASLIAGEEPEMCFRLREIGWKIRRLGEEMTLHDAAMSTIGQWWNRAKRSGYAYAEGCSLHGKSPEQYRVRQVLSILFWAGLLPVIILMSGICDSRLFFLCLLYPLQLLKLTLSYASQLNSSKIAYYYAVSNLGSKLPQFSGMMRFVLNKLKGRRGTLIEYK